MFYSIGHGRLRPASFRQVIGRALGRQGWILAVLALWLVVVNGASAEGPAPFIYMDPKPGAQLVSAGTAIAMRTGDLMREELLSAELFAVTGSKSGRHPGQVGLADDGTTVIFQPFVPFMPGETVNVVVAPGLMTLAGEALAGSRFAFQVSPKQPALAARAFDLSSYSPGNQVGWVSSTSGAGGPNASPEYATVPSDFPRIAVTSAASSPPKGFIFLNYFSNDAMIGQEHPYMLILDDQGEPVFYRRMALNQLALDVKVQPNGLLTYYDRYARHYLALDETYTVVDTYRAGNGYWEDHHDLQVLPDGSQLYIIYDPQPVDMSQVVPGGRADAIVVGLVVQELDPSRHVVFQWRSWDHIPITDSAEDLTAPFIDYVHGNAVDKDLDGNLVISSRNLEEITKIDRQTGEVIWRWGGRANQFTFTNDPRPFSRQHDIRVLPDGHYTLFDNGNDLEPRYSRAVEYAMDEAARTVTKVWEYRNTPDTYGAGMGNVQRLSGGHTMIGWGTGLPTLTEVRPDGSKSLELTFEAHHFSYRAFRFPWQGHPTWPPVAVINTEAGGTRLIFSWNGATEISAYRVYAGSGPQPDVLVGTQPKTGFETSMDITELLNQYCSFRVMPLDSQEQETTFSNVIFGSGDGCPRYFVPCVQVN